MSDIPNTEGQQPAFPGAGGSTLSRVLRTHAKEYSGVTAQLLQDAATEIDRLTAAKLGPTHRDEINRLIEESQEDLEGVLYRLVGEREQLKALRDGDNKLIMALADDAGIKITCSPRLLGRVWEQFHAGVMALARARDGSNTQGQPRPSNSGNPST